LHKNPYTSTGLSLLVTGILVSLTSIFILHLDWLTATGIAMLILSLILLALGRSIPKLPPEASAILLQTGIDNIASIVEELGISSKAIYLPSSLTGGKPQALIPLHSNPSLPSITRAVPQRLIARYGDNPNDIGLLVSTEGTTAATMLESRPGPTTAELEPALTSLLMGTLGVADKATVIARGSNIRVTIYKPRIEDKSTWFHECLGGPLASIVASVTAEAQDRPITIKQEEHSGSKYSIDLEVLGEDI
jgi:hypothetical protein